MRTLEELKRTIRAGLGQIPCDLVLENVELVNVCSKEVYPTKIYILDGRVISIEPEAQLEAAEHVDCGGLYAVPGLIDSHMHFESTMLAPEALAEFLVPAGTTTICAGLMEIANVCGEAGIRAMLAGYDRLPYRMLVEVSSRVPTAPGLETDGAVMDDVSVNDIMQDETSISLGELDPSKILGEKEEYLKKIINTLQMRKIVNGHAIGRYGQELNVYASAGILDDHECVTREEMRDRMRLGMGVFVREGSSERNLDALVQGILDWKLPMDDISFCTDDKHIDDIKTEGHINYNVNRAIELGMEPLDAIAMATINAARHFRLEDKIGSITPGRQADILLCPSKQKLEPQSVLYRGKFVIRDGERLFSTEQMGYPEWIYDTVHLRKPVTEQSFALPCGGQAAQVNVIELIPDQIINHWGIYELPVAAGELQRDPAQDIQKIAVVERYAKNGNIGVGFVKGFTLRRGAVAYSMSHDHHNIVVIGTNDRDMAVCVNRIVEMHGGLAAAEDGEVLASMPLEIGGLMSTEPTERANARLHEMNAAAASLGCTLASPYMTLSFISLPTVPELGLTDMGLIDVIHTRVIPLCNA